MQIRPSRLTLLLVLGIAYRLPALQPSVRCNADSADLRAKDFNGALAFTIAGGMKEGTVTIPDRELDERVFPVLDYTGLATPVDSLRGSSQLLPGEYRARILPPGRTHRLFRNAPDLDVGKDGALIVTPFAGDSAFCRQAPLIVHSGEADSVNVRWTRSLVMEPADLQLILGALAMTRFFLAEYTSWDEIAGAIGIFAGRDTVFDPYVVQVTQRQRSWSEALFGRFGKTAPLPVRKRSNRTTRPIMLSVEELHSAQSTAGMNALDYWVRIHSLSRRIEPALAELSPIVMIEDDTQRAARLKQLSQPTLETLALFEATARGLREDIDAGTIDSSYNEVAQRLEQVVGDLQAYTDRPAVDQGFGEAEDNGALWTAPAVGPPPPASCDLTAVERKIPAKTLKLEGGVQLPVDGFAIFSFASGTQPSTFRLNADVRVNVDAFRAAHRQYASMEVAKRTKNCNERPALRETDQTVTSSGAIAAKANVRTEFHACVKYKWPCKWSIRGTESCTKVMSSRIGALTVGVSTRVTTNIQGTKLAFRIPQGDVTIGVDTISADLRRLHETVAFRGDAARFALKDSRIWNVIGLKGTNNLGEPAACVIANQLRQSQ